MNATASISMRAPWSRLATWTAALADRFALAQAAYTGEAVGPIE